jgi:PAS domain S-box-containing protein
MKLNKLLERQLQKFLPPDFVGKEELTAFINAVNDSYNSFERDLELSERAFRISEEEYRNINAKLNNEIAEREASLSTLRETFNQLHAGTTEEKGISGLLHMAISLQKKVSDLSDTEQKLLVQKKFYERILNEIPADIAILDRNRTYLFINPHAVKDQATREWMIGRTDEEYTAYRNRPVDATNARKEFFNEVVARGRKLEQEERMVNRNGETEHHLRVLSPVFDENGEFDIMIIYGVNITERKKVEEQVRLSENRFRSIFDNSLALICVHDMNGLLLDVNSAVVNTLGYNADQLVGAPLYRLIPESRRFEFETTYMKQLLQDGKASGIMVAIGSNGKQHYLLYQNYLVTENNTTPHVIGFAQDITPRIEAEKLLKASEEKYRNIIANMNLGLLEVDNNEVIVYANNSFCEMSGYELDELIGKSPIQLFLRGENQLSGDKVIERRRNGMSDAYELKVKDKRGNIKWWLVSGGPAYDSDGVMKGTIGIHLDITLQKTLEMELRQAKADAERSARAKETFLANMSHEIRTPMNAILGITGLLGKSELQPQQRGWLGNIQTAANNLLVIINDLLDFSKIESGKMTIERIGFHLHVVISNAVQILRHRAEEKGILLLSDCDSIMAPVLLGDPYRLNQVLMNLLSNAIKFTENGSVTLACRVAEADAASQTIVFSVSDTGIGMSAEFMAHLFDKFSQEDESISRRYGGTGLGMSIIRQLVELMGGTIKVTSEKNKGTTISFTLRFVRGNTGDVPQTRYSSIDTQILKDKSILLVEDNELNRLLASAILSDYGAKVTEAGNGAIAIQQMTEHYFDLVLMDVQMPVKDGIEATKYIRANIDPGIPIIALTANALKSQEQQCLAAGMNDFIAKPFTESRLVQLVGKWLGRETAIATPEATVSDEQNDAPADLSKLQEISRGDEAFVTRMLSLFVEKTPPLLQQLSAAGTRGDLSQVAFLAHRIKSSVSIMGIPGLDTVIAQLEQVVNEPLPDAVVKAHIQLMASKINAAMVWMTNR